MKKSVIRIVILISLLTLFFSCSKSERPQQAGTTAPVQDMTIGIDVPLETAKKEIIGKWNLIRASKFYTEFKLGKPATITFNANGTYEFHIQIATTANTGKLSYKGKWVLENPSNRLIITFNRTHKAFENDWKESEGKDGAVLKFLKSDYKTAIINIVNIAWYAPMLSEDLNNYWERETPQNAERR